MAILAGRFVHVIGVDTHKRSLTAAVLNSLGGVLESCEVPANNAGHRHLLAIGARYSGPLLWAVEGTEAYGASLTERLVGAGYAVTEVDRPKRPARKDEDGACQPPPASGRDELGNAAPSVPRIQSAQSRERAAGEEVRGCAARSATGEDQTRLRTMRDVSRLILDLSRQADACEREMKHPVEAMAPGLLVQPGLGTLTAAQIMVSWSHPGRIASEAAFASLAGVAPIPASSGQTVRYRLNHGGDRKFNAALHTVVLSLCRYDRATRDYLAGRTAEGKTQREIRRSLKRYLARQLFRFLSALDKG